MAMSLYGICTASVPADIDMYVVIVMGICKYIFFTHIRVKFMEFICYFNGAVATIVYTNRSSILL